MTHVSMLVKVEEFAGANAAIAESLRHNREPDLLAALAQTATRSAEGSPAIARMTAIDLDSLPRDSETVELGRRILARWSRSLHQFMCTSDDKEDEELRTRVWNAITGKDGGATALLAGTLVAAFGASPALAALVAALLMKFMISPARDEICSAWKASLGPGGAGS